MKSMRTKRALSWALVLCMILTTVFGMTTVTSFAGEGSVTKMGGVTLTSGQTYGAADDIGIVSGSAVYTLTGEPGSQVATLTLSDGFEFASGAGIYSTYPTLEIDAAEADIEVSGTVIETTGDLIINADYFVLKGQNGILAASVDANADASLTILYEEKGIDAGSGAGDVSLSSADIYLSNESSDASAGSDVAINAKDVTLSGGAVNIYTIANGIKATGDLRATVSAIEGDFFSGIFSVSAASGTAIDAVNVSVSADSVYATAGDICIDASGSVVLDASVNVNITAEGAASEVSPGKWDSNHYGIRAANGVSILAPESVSIYTYGAYGIVNTTAGDVVITSESIRVSKDLLVGADYAPVCGLINKADSLTDGVKLYTDEILVYVFRSGIVAEKGVVEIHGLTNPTDYMARFVQDAPHKYVSQISAAGIYSYAPMTIDGGMWDVFTTDTTVPFIAGGDHVISGGKYTEMAYMAFSDLLNAERNAKAFVKNTGDEVYVYQVAPGAGVFEIAGKSSYYRFNDAISAAVDDDVIQVNSDCVLNTTTVDKEVTLKLANGVQCFVTGPITVASGGTLKVERAGTSGMAYIDGLQSFYQENLNERSLAFRPFKVSSGGMFILADGVTVKNFTLKETNSSIDKGAVVLVENGGTFNMIGGSIKNCNAVQGGAVYVEEGGCFNFTGGTIEGNWAMEPEPPGSELNTNAKGGGIYNAGTVNMSGTAKIINCAASAGQGGGIYVDASTNAIFNMLSGQISNCAAMYVLSSDPEAEYKYVDDGWGGGVFLESIDESHKATMRMAGGEISQCVALEEGGGVYVYSDAVLEIGGNAKITDCQSSKVVDKKTVAVKSNVYLEEGALMQVIGECPPSDAVIGVHTGNPVAECNPVTIAAVDISAFVVPDNEKEEVVSEGGFTIMKKVPFSITWKLNGGQAVGEMQAVVYPYSYITKPTTPTKEGYKFGGWYSDAAFENAWLFEGGWVEDDITLYAMWIKNTEETQQISGTITAPGGTPVDGASVGLYQGANCIAITASDASGNYSFDNVVAGDYNVKATGLVVTSMMTKTSLITVTSSSGATVNIELPASNRVSSEVEISTDAPTPNVVASGIDKVAENLGTVTTETSVKLVVTGDSYCNDVQHNEIKQLASGKDINYIDLSLQKIVPGGCEDLGNTNTVVLEVFVPFDTKNRSDLNVIRSHYDGASVTTSAFEKLDVRPADGSEDGKYYVSNKGVFIYASKFSTYAIVYNKTGGGGGGRVMGAVTPEAITAPAITANPFVDVASDAYYYDAVMWAVEKGITSGVDATHFGPNGITNRAQMVTFLWNAAGRPEVSGAANPFKDVAASSYYEKAVQWAVANGITTGISADTFAPDVNVTRAQAVTFLARQAGKAALGGGTGAGSGSGAALGGGTVAEPAIRTFSDVAADAYYRDAVDWASACGITTGKGNGLFGPDDTCLRGQIVTFLYRCFR